MKEKILIVEDQFVEADYLRLMLTEAGYEVMGIAHSVVQAREIIRQSTPEFVLLDIFLKGKSTGIDLARQLAEENIPFVYLSANSNEDVLNAAKATQPYGFLVKPYREKDLLVTLEVARYRHKNLMEANLKRQDCLTSILSVILKDQESWNKKLLDIATTIQSLIPFDYLTAGFNTINHGSSRALSLLRIGYDEYQQIGPTELLNITRLKMRELTKLLENTSFPSTPFIANEALFERLCMQPALQSLFSTKFEVRSQLSLPLKFSNEMIFMLEFYSRKPAAYVSGHIRLLESLQKSLAEGFERVMNTSNGRRNDDGTHNNQPEKLSKQTGTQGFEGIIGRSHLLLNVFDLVTQVAPSETSVLILGESGTGKERIADCLHHLSPRRLKPFVKVNCATLPPNLIESELFGHEKGSFTGAFDKRVGKFEKADEGTIFLDEIGEMPLDLQVKLLRVLQEKYIERIGSRDVTIVDVRIIAATNRNLEKEVAEGRFRLDLYYRLNVFPITLPALRDRTEDIAALAKHFTNYYSRKSGKNVTGLSDRVLKNLVAYHWPGNIRELENLIERSVLLARGSTIDDIPMPAAPKAGMLMASQEIRMKTIHENEREYILEVLKKCNGRVWGSGGAAEVLNLPPSTLKSKMKKLGIRKEYE